MEDGLEGGKGMDMPVSIECEGGGPVDEGVHLIGNAHDAGGIRG